MRKSGNASGFAAYAERDTPQTPHFDGSTTYSYDLNGNRTMAGYSTGSDNRLSFDGTYTYTYNAEGDLTQKVSTTATWTYSWDNLDRMVGVEEVTTTGTQLSVSYVYDVLNNRVEDDTWKPGTGTVTVRHAYDGSNIWADVTTTNTLLARYVYGDGTDQVWARAVPAGQPNSGVGWYLTDRQGSVRDIMDSSSVIQDHIDYDGYGDATHTMISVADREGYAGGQTDLNTGLVQERNRWYEPPSGRWMSEDPIGFGGGDTNLGRYVGNGPTNAVDPSGFAQNPMPPVVQGVPVLVPGPAGQGPISPSTPNWLKPPPTNGWKSPFGGIDIPGQVTDAYYFQMERWRKQWEAMGRLPMYAGKEWYEVPNPPGAQGYPPGFLKKDLHARVLFLTEGLSQGFFWLPSNCQDPKRIGSYGQLKAALTAIPANSLDMLIISGHNPNFYRQHCGAKFGKSKEQIEDKAENNIDERMPEDVADLIATRLSKDGILVFASCYGGWYKKGVKEIAALIKHGVAAANTFCNTSASSALEADIDSTFPFDDPLAGGGEYTRMGGWCNDGYATSW
jgi:RHS repeat-associated protein